jgi:hypothetical protein
MSDDHRTQWAKYYKAFLADNIEALGGEESITPLRRQSAKTLATLQTELAILTDRFAASRGGNAEGLVQFLKISGEISAQQKALGLDRPKRESAPPPGESGLERLVALLNGIVRSNEAKRRVEESRGIYRTVDGAIITPEMLSTRSLRSESPAPLPSASPASLSSPPSPSVAPRVEPDVIPAPAEPNSTQRYYQWLNEGGGGGSFDMSPNPSWPRLR